ncbi:MAG: hypothetical protein AABW72_01185 [archaeon]
MKIRNIVFISLMFILFLSLNAYSDNAFSLSNKVLIQGYGLGNYNIIKDAVITETITLQDNGDISYFIGTNFGIPLKYIKNMVSLITVPLLGKDYLLYSINGSLVTTQSSKISKIGLLDPKQAKKYKKGDKIKGLSLYLTQNNLSKKTPVVIEVTDFVDNEYKSDLYPPYSVKFTILDKTETKTLDVKTVMAGGFEYFDLKGTTFYVNDVKKNTATADYAMIIPNASKKQIFLEDKKKFKLPNQLIPANYPWIVQFGELTTTDDGIEVIKVITLRK